MIDLSIQTNVIFETDIKKNEIEYHKHSITFSELRTSFDYAKSGSGSLPHAAFALSKQ